MTGSRTQSAATSWRATGRTLLFGAAVWLAAQAPAGAACVGDCNSDATVAINELILGVNIASGNSAIAACAVFDANHDGMVSINELILGVNNALGSCPVEATPTATTAGQTPTATATPVATTSPGNPVCGNGVIEGDETCDDGNTEDGDNCPPDCHINSCADSTTTLDADVLIQLPNGAVLGALQVFVHYPDGVVSLPSSGSQAQVAISNLPDDAFTVTVNDVDYAVRVLTIGPDGLTLGDSPPNRFFTARFTRCQGAAAPSTADFSCTVETATEVDLTDITTQTTCSVSLP